MRACGWILAAAILCFGATAKAEAPEFRVDSEVWVGKEKTPVGETLTIFTGQYVYDFLLSKPEEVIVFDKTRGQITLLDKQRKLRSIIATDDVLQFSAAYKTRKPESPIFAFCTNPVFEESTQSDGFTLKSNVVSYKVTTMKPKTAGTERIYREFADWSARLNAMRPGNLPPFARLELNKSLAANGVLPVEIERTITSATSPITSREETVRSRHLFNWTLSLEDRKRIEKAGDMLTDFEVVEFAKYIGVDDATGKTASR